MASSSEAPEQEAPKRSALARVTSDPVSRRKFVALTGGSAALSAFLAACGGGSDSSSSTATMQSTTEKEEMKSAGGGSETEQFGKGDLGILNYALPLEYLEAAFYAEVVKSK